ncbi:uncharacterized protein LOC134707891 isoform X3 [Mytilus trossulus]|uniref:uncharacterized protein LOC134707891 isoform X3 n=1 Tax=Mytilus trossulus TaxID=6551 RepID=UPI0030052C31
MIDLCKIKEDFSGLVKEAQPWTLTQFVMWLDLKLSEFKIKGYMVLDHHTKTKPKWIEEEDSTSDVAPIPAPCRTCNKHSNDGHFYSDIHSSPASHRNVTRETKNAQPMEESESMRGEVGIIDLSHAEISRKQNSARMLRPPDDMSLKKSYQNTSYHEKSPNIQVERDKSRQDDVIEIDVPSPTEKMFITSNINKTSTPIIHSNIRPIQKPKNRPSLSMGTAIYTTTSSVTTPTFSSSYMSSPSRNIPPTFANRKFALGAPPPPLVAPSNLANLDEMIAQAVQFNEIRTGADNASSQSQIRQSSGQSDVRPPPMQQQPPKIQESDHISSFSEQHSRQTLSEQHSRQTLSEQHSRQTLSEQHSRQTLSEQHSRQTLSEQHSRQTNISEQKLPYSQQTSTSSSAVPIALHANIDNINISQNSAHSSSDTMEIKIETEVDDSVADSFFVGNTDTRPSGMDTVSDLSIQSHDSSLQRSHDSVQQRSHDLPVPSGDLPRQGLVDPETAKAFQMVELVNGSSVYVYERTIQQAFKIGTESQTGTYNGEKMARYLLNVFWSRKELVGATLSKAGRGKKILNQQIIEAILDFCEINSRHRRSVCKTVIDRSLSSRLYKEKKKIEMLYMKWGSTQDNKKF